MGRNQEHYQNFSFGRYQGRLWKVDILPVGESQTTKLTITPMLNAEILLHMTNTINVSSLVSVEAREPLFP